MKAALKKKWNPFTSDPDSATSTVTLAAEAANMIAATITLKDAKKRTFAARRAVRAWLSDAATGVGLAAAVPSGGVAAGASGSVLNAAVAGKLLDCLTDAAGLLILNITEVTAKTFYLCVEYPDKTFSITAVVFV